MKLALISDVDENLPSAFSIGAGVWAWNKSLCMIGAFRADTPPRSGAGAELMAIHGKSISDSFCVVDGLIRSSEQTKIQKSQRMNKIRSRVAVVKKC